MMNLSNYCSDSNGDDCSANTGHLSTSLSQMQPAILSLIPIIINALHMGQFFVIL